MAEKEFVVLYTHQKTKKAKTWQDGVLKLNLTSSRGVLYDDNGRKLDTVFIKNVQNVISEELESDRYLIQVEEEKPSAAGSSAVIKHTTRADSVTTKSVISLGNQRSNSLQHTSSLLRTGLKRKRSGFIPPRQIKQPKEVEEPAPSSNQAVTPSPPRLCPEAARPPALFGAIGHKSSLLTLYADRRKKLDTDGPSDGQVARLQPPPEPQQPARLSILHQNQYSSKSNQCDTDWHNGRLKTDRSASYSSREQINESGIISTDGSIQEQHTTSDNSDVTAKRSASQILALIGGKSKKQNLLSRANSREYIPHNITSNLQNAVPNSTKEHKEVNAYLLKSDNFSTELDKLDLSVNKVSTNDLNKSEDKRLCRVDQNSGMSSSSFSETCSSKHAPDYSLGNIIQENLISGKNKSDTSVSVAADFTGRNDKPKNQMKEDSNFPDVPISSSFQSADNCDTILALGNMDFNTPSSSVILNPGDHLSDSNYPNNSTSCDLTDIQKDVSDNLEKVDDEEEEEEACFDINLSPFSQSDNSLWDDNNDTDIKASPGTSRAASQEPLENNEPSTSDLTNSKSSQNICSSDIDVDTSKLNEHFSDSNNSCEESDVNRTEIRKETRGDCSVIGDMNVKEKSSNSQQVLLLPVPEVTDSKNEGATINYHHKENLISGREVKDHLDNKTEAYQEISTIHGNAARNDPDSVADMECHELRGATERVDEYGNYTTLNKIEKLCVSSENVCERVTVCYETDGESAITGHMKKDGHYSEKTGEMLNANNYVDLDYSPEIPVHLELLKNTLKADHMQMSSEEIHPSSDLMEGNNFDFYQKHQPNKTLRSNSSCDGFSSLNHKRENTLAQSPEFTDNEHYGAISGEVHNLFQNSANFDPGGGLNEQSDWHEEPSVINVEDPATDRLPFLSQITRSSCSTRMNKKPDIDLSKRKDSFILKSSRDPQERITGKLAPSQMKCASGSSLPHPSDAFKGKDATVRLDSFYQRTPKDFLAAVDMKNELQFPGKMELETRTEPCCRKAVIPSTFLNVQEYKQALCAALNEHINTLFCDLARNYHTALAKVDISKYVPNLKGKFGSVKSNHNPSCEHGLPSKMVQVKKEGPNQGRYFFACDESRENQCKFFKWADQLENSSSRKPGGREAGPECSKLQLSDADSISTYFKGQNISLYCDCQLVRKTQQDIRAHFFKSKPWQKKYKNDDENCSRKKLFLKLSRRENSSAYTKDDVWVISRNLNFEPNSTFLAKSVFYGPSAENEIEVEPMSRFSPSNWSNEVVCYALHANNIANELACLYNITEHVNTTLPLLPSLLNRDMCSRINRGGFQTPGQTLKNNIFIPLDLMMEIAEEHITKYRLNEDQATSLRNVASMFNTDSSKTPQAFTLIHGVFGAGKSFLLAVVVLFLVRMFELNESYTPGVPVPMKLLISSTTNVAVDRILQGLLDLKFDEFIRVGSVKKIAKPVLPYSVHAAGSKSQELKELQEMLKGDITPSEKHYVRKSIEKLRLGENKKKLGVVRVVGVTCAAASFSCMAGMTFSVVLLDECSQMTEPASLLPIAKFECEKLVLVGDPKQLSPTIGGFESVHDQGLEQTLFDRLVKMGHVPVMLRTQYRCHPVISGIANSLFYDGQLMDGITEADRQHLAPELPTLAFYDVCDGQECYDKYASYYNIGEAEFIVDLIDGLLLSGVEPQMIGVITLYKSQMQKIKAVLQSSKLVENSELQAIQVSTVDAFQGGEKGVIILSCVRTRYVGFIDSDKRTNVALTRSKSHLLIVGHLQNLSRNGLWGKVIQYCRAIPDGIQNVEVTKNHIKDMKIRLESKLESNQAESGSSSSRKKNKVQKKRAFTSLPGGQTSQTPPPSSGSFSGNFEWQPVNVEQPAELTFTPDTAADEEMHSSQASSSPPHQPTVLSRRRPSHQLDTGLYQTQQPEQLSDEDLPDLLHR